MSEALFFLIEADTGNDDDVDFFFLYFNGMTGIGFRYLISVEDHLMIDRLICIHLSARTDDRIGNIKQFIDLRNIDFTVTRIIGKHSLSFQIRMQFLTDRF